jgi:hypothetical protein
MRLALYCQILDCGSSLNLKELKYHATTIALHSFALESLQGYIIHVDLALFQFQVMLLSLQVVHTVKSSFS